jgi:hypothetical protein
MRWNEILTETVTMKLYHGTPHDFTDFDTDKSAPYGAFGAGFYFSNDLSLGRTYSQADRTTGDRDKDPMVCTVTLKNPWYVDYDLPYTSEERERQKKVFRKVGARERLMQMGYDGVIVKQGPYREVIVYDPKAIVNHGRGKTLKLQEGRLAPLYHGTSLSAAIEMLHENVFRAGSSLSRSYDVAAHFADKTPTKLDDNRHDLSALERLEYEADLGTCAILAFDQAKLMHNVGLEPFNWYHENAYSDTYQRGHEYEEITKRDARPITRYLTGINATDFAPFTKLAIEQFPEYEPTIRLMSQMLHIPVYPGGALHRFRPAA